MITCGPDSLKNIKQMQGLRTSADGNTKVQSSLGWKVTTVSDNFKVEIILVLYYC